MRQSVPPEDGPGLRKRPDFNTIMSCDFIPDLFRTATAGLVPVGALTDWLERAPPTDSFRFRVAFAAFAAFAAFGGEGNAKTGSRSTPYI
ncbi:MAG TPA: hypothetical protein VF278_09205 [Pirellulales bacterium]